MKARKILAGMLAMSMVLSLAACGSSDTDTTAASSTTAAATEAGDEASAAEEGNATEAEGEETEATPTERRRENWWTMRPVWPRFWRI